jgi:hypothetical protein
VFRENSDSVTSIEMAEESDCGLEGEYDVNLIIRGAPSSEKCQLSSFVHPSVSSPFWPSTAPCFQTPT